MSIPHVAYADPQGCGAFYYPNMADDWSSRLRQHLRGAGISLAHAGKLVGRGPAIAGHWLSGRRKINLDEFFLLCNRVGADPKYILFGADETIQQIAAIIANPHYSALQRRLTGAEKPAIPAHSGKKAPAK